MRLIDADALEEEIVKARRYVPKDAVLDVAYMVNRAPTIEAKPVVRARWEVVSHGEDKWVNKCSACGGYLKRGYKQTNYCPNCGAQMPGGSLAEKNDTQKMSVDSGYCKNCTDHKKKIIITDATNEEIDEYLKKTYKNYHGGHPDPVGEKGECGVKIPVVSMEDVPKIMKAMEEGAEL